MDEKAVRRWLKSTERELMGIVAAITNTPRKSLRNRLTNAMVVKVGAAGAVSGAWGLASLGTAGTGTAIGTLSGAAAQSATLAWLGFGSVAVGSTLVVPAFMLAGGWVLLRAWKGKGRPPESLSADERELISACAGMAVGLEEERQSDRQVSRDELALVVSDVLRPLSQRLAAYKGASDYEALKVRSQVALSVRVVRLDHQIAMAEEWWDV